MNRPTNRVFYSFFILLCALILSCQNSSENKKNKPESNITNSDNKVTADQSGNEQPGKALYKKYCLTCHQANGSGVTGIFPPLGQGSWVGKNPTELINMIVKGLSGEIEVNGETYKNSMPPQNKITDEELAEVLTYVRSNFGNHFKPIAPDRIKKARTAQ